MPSRIGRTFGLAGANNGEFALKDSKPKFTYVSPHELTPHPNNPKRHPRHQIRKMAQSMKSFGFNSPVLADENGRILAGHGRVAAAKKAGLTEIPVIYLTHLSEDEATAFMLADNKLAEISKWDDPLLATVIKELAGKELEFELEDTGFETAELDRLVHQLEEPGLADTVDEFEVSSGPAVTMHGDVWKLGKSTVVCGSALDGASYHTLGGAADFATMTFADPPWNLPVNGHISGRGKIQHREFAQGSGEMSREEFQDFMNTAFETFTFWNGDGALLYICTDWRNYEVMLIAARACRLKPVNVCVWVKNNGGMGSFYRSQHEFVLVFQKGDKPHRNNVQLGRNGRNRTNVWNYPAATVPVKGKRPLEYHPTPKPVLMVADAIQDCTQAGNLVMDPFLGSGTTLLAAERSGRRAYGIELDPLYVDTTIRRWEKMTGQKAKHAKTGQTFAQISAERLPDGN
ncbi:MAG: ParB N-terminal domain-containing protein [Alphaproteobacteria bacterium]|nr:ParB N-terminal domain-containing protein [Alphaproteobacteria bacterium]